ncbi:hypothetical protein [Acidocella aquatica]|uniref:hypothetical protein n=1 Tax=Acidocella aquatica TaxID=1922313 RepID=UPI0024E13126|nr:hypothetical protein [Acidocella aquatica]
MPERNIAAWLRKLLFTRMRTLTGISMSKNAQSGKATARKSPTTEISRLMNRHADKAKAVTIPNKI